MVKTIFIEEYVQTILYHGPHHSFHPDTYPDFLIILVHYGNQGMLRLKAERRLKYWTFRVLRWNADNWIIYKNA